MKPTDKEFNSWVRSGKRHPFYKQSVEAMDDLKVHAEGIYPTALIEERRPSESESVKDYRKKIYIGKTVAPVGKVITSLSKIRKAADYSIRFDETTHIKTIREEESLENYTMFNFPRYTSLDNWYWSVCFGVQLIDSNAVSITMPLNPVREANEYAKPYPVIFTSDQVLDYRNDEFYFVQSNEISYYEHNKQMQDGKVFYFVDTTHIYRYDQINSKGEYSVTEVLHGLNYLPVVKLQGVVQRDIMKHSLYRSRLSPMIPELKEAVREYSDLQAGVLQSMFPTYWYYQSVRCNTCKGIGSIPGAKGATECKVCKGKGDFPFNPYEHVSMSVKQTELGQNPAPTPPGGIIEKDTKIIEIQDKRVNDHLYNALAAVNMEHLATVPLSQSGTAKEWDRAEASNFAYSIAEDCVRVMDEHFFIINDYRYSFVVPDKKKRTEMLPSVNVPMRFDLTSDTMLAEDIGKLKTAKFNQTIIAAAEVDYSNRRFVTDPVVREMVAAQYELDPLSGKTDDDILLSTSGGWVLEESAIIHANIKEFIERAMEENALFLTLPLKDKKAKMKEYAEAFKKEKSAKQSVMNEILKAQEDVKKEKDDEGGEE